MVINEVLCQTSSFIELHSSVVMFGNSVDRFRSCKAPITALQLHRKYTMQAFSAGVGNWVADEVLYQAKLYPEVKASALTDEDIGQLHKALKSVSETAVEAEAESEKFPQDWLFHVRWGGPKKSPKLNGNAVEFLKVGGRVSHTSMRTSKMELGK